MSEENTAKITSVVKTKDPRRVEAGKRLAAISKEAKKRKAAATSAPEFPDTSSMDSTDSTDLKEIGLMVSVVGILVGAAGLYYKFGKKPECTNTIVADTYPNEEQAATETTSAEEVPKSKPKTKLDTLD